MIIWIYRSITKSLILLGVLHACLHGSEAGDALQAPYIYHSVNVITGSYVESNIDFAVDGPHPLTLKRCYQSQVASNPSSLCGWFTSLPSLFISRNQEDVHLPELGTKSYFDKENRLVEVMALCPKGREVFHWMKFVYREENEQTVCSVETDDRTTLTYRYRTDKSSHQGPCVYLESVEKNGIPVVRYEYKAHPTTRSLLLTRREEPNNRYLIAEYYDQKRNEVGDCIVELDSIDARWGKVKLLMAPVGSDDAPVITHRFFYGKGYTEVRDVYDQKIIYRYEDLHRLTAIEYYDASGDLYRTERYTWEARPSLPEPLLIKKSVENGQGEVVVYYVFEYDKQGNKKKESFFGNLTGKEGGESYSICYKYKNNQLVSKEEGDCIKTHYVYDDKLRVKLEHKVVDGLYHIRTFYEYDNRDRIRKTIVDDGLNDSSKDYTGVQYRQITKMDFSSASSSFGLPLQVEQFYWDKQTQEEISTGKIVNRYNLRGLLGKQKTFDADGLLTQTLRYEYDDFGRIIMEQEEGKGITVSVYDVNGNVAERVTHQADGDCSCGHYQYDCSNRLIRCDEINSASEVATHRIWYDLKGRKKAEADDGGNKTHYSYDFLDRLVALKQPGIIDHEGKKRTPRYTYQYDISDNMCASQDPNGWETRIHYNARGKPVEILYPDGTREAFTYNLAGMLIKERSKEGLVTTQSLDGLGRSIMSSTEDLDGRLLSKTSKAYNSFYLVASTDALGGRSIYHYDGAGRVSKVIEQAQEGSKQTSYFYDAKGRVLEKRLLSPAGYTAEFFTYEQGDQPIAVTLQDEQGNILQEISLQPPAEEPKTVHKGKEYNELGQEVRFVQVVDKSGNSAKTIYNALDKPAKVVQKDSLDKVTSHREFRYDPAGNKTKEIYYHFEKDAPFILSWHYGLGNRQEIAIEGEGAPRQRVTSYAYNSKGQMKRLTKPNGVGLHYKYYPTGRVRQVFSSDQTISYTYEYDAKGNVISLEDALNGTKTSRTFTAFNLKSFECLANGLMMSYEYDAEGKCTQVQFPDGSGVKYSYTGPLLKQIHRIKNNEVVYSHAYVENDNQHVKSSELIGKTGRIDYTYNDRHQISAIASSFYSEKNKFDESGHLIRSKVQDPLGSISLHYCYNDKRELVQEEGIISAQYRYDSLGNRLEAETDMLNQQARREGAAYSYDANGNLIRETSEHRTLDYSYDALNRLCSVTEPKKTSTRYTYDGCNRRMSKTVFYWKNNHWIEKEHEKYLYDGLCEIGAFDPRGKAKQLRILGIGNGVEIGASVAIELEGRVYAPINDSRGSIAAMISVDDKECAEFYRYTAFGTQLVFDANGEELQESALGMPWGFFGKRADSETGWVFFGLRHYDPSIGRWTTPDPLGHLDGPNRYAFVHNNPIMNRDFLGEFSVSEAWTYFSKAAKFAYSGINRALNRYEEIFGFSRSTKHQFVESCNFIFGPQFLRLAGFCDDFAEVGVVGKGEVSDKVRITVINGILNIRAEYIQSVSFFSHTHGGANIHYIFRPSAGLVFDLLQCVPVKLGLISSQAGLLAGTWKQLINEMGGPGGGGVIVHYAHSIGGAETNNAKRLLSPEERAMIKVITFGSACLIPDGDFQSVVNYVSWRDGVSYLDPIRYIRGFANQDGNLRFLGSPLGIPLVDHFLENLSYATAVRGLGGDFVRTYGSVN